MRWPVAIVGILGSMATLCFATDLDEARRILGAQPEQALSMARAALATDPRDIEAHVVAVKALRLLGRADEAIAPLEAWSSESRDAFPPLWLLFDLRAGMRDWTSVANLAARAPAEPVAERRKFLQAIVLAELENERYTEAVSTLSMTPAPVAEEPLADAFAALAASAAGEWWKALPDLGRFLTSGVDDATQTRVLWWTAELARTAGWSAPPGEEYPAGGVAGGTASDPSLPITPTETVVLPVLRRKVEPRYPEEARASRIEGKVTVQTVVLKTGQTAFPTVLASTNRMFDRAAREAIIGWRYEPARQNGQAVAVYYTIVVKFTLSDSSLSGPGHNQRGNRPR